MKAITILAEMLTAFAILIIFFAAYIVIAA